MTLTSYKAAISVLSDELPLHGLCERDVQMSQDLLRLTMAEYGPAGTFVTDALNEWTNKKCDETWTDVIACRLLNPDLCDAALGSGIALQSALYAYAAHLIVRDVDALRDEQKVPDDGSDEAFSRYLAREEARYDASKEAMP